MINPPKTVHDFLPMFMACGMAAGSSAPADPASDG
jgi:hypothetical protein